MAPDDDAGRPQEVQIDLTFAPPTRVAAYMHGGDAHFEVDREVAERMFASVAGGADAFRAVGRASQAFLERVVGYLTVDAGIRQFLVMGCNLSGERNVHDIAQAEAPESRAVYVLLDPLMLAYAHKLRRGANNGTTAYVQASLRDLDEILGQSASILDLTQPVAVVMPGNLGFVRDLGRACQIVDGLKDGVPAGSYLVITHQASDLFVDEHAGMFQVTTDMAAEGKTWALVPRSQAEVLKLFAGLELVEPGVVPMDEWRVSDPDHEPVRAAMHAAVGRK